VARWGLLVVLATAATGAAVLGWPIPAVAGGIAAVVAGGMALVQQLGSVGPPQLDSRPLGKGPYTSCDATPDASFVERLARLNEQLRDAAASEDWVIDWTRFNSYSSQAFDANRTCNYSEAVRQYSRANSYMMEQLRSQRVRSQQQTDREGDFDLL